MGHSRSGIGDLVSHMNIIHLFYKKTNFHIFLYCNVKTIYFSLVFDV